MVKQISAGVRRMIDNLREQEMENESEGMPVGSSPIEHLSPSKIDMHARCPMQIEWRYVKGVVAPPQIRLIEGSKYHEAAAIRNLMLRDGKKPVTKKEMSDFFRDTMADEVSRTGVKTIVWDDENKDIDVVMERSKTLLPILYDKLAPMGTPTSVEERMSGVIAGVPIVAITDLEDEGGVADYKVVTNKKSQGVADSSIQLSVYSFLRSEKKVRLDQLIKRGGFERTRSTRGPGDMKWLERVVTLTWKSIQSGIFPPCDPTSWICSPKWCGWYSQCRGSCYSTGRKEK